MSISSPTNKFNASDNSQPKLHYEVHPGDGPTMLLVHGLLCSRALWDINIEALKTVCSPVTVELYGHGRSPAPIDPKAYCPDQYVFQLEQIRKELGVSKFMLCGHSLGASLTIRYALNYPQQVLCHVFTNSSSAFAEAKEVTKPPERLIAHFENGGLEVVNKIPVHPSFAKRLPEQIKNSLMADSKLINPAAIGRTIAYTHPYASIRNRMHLNETPALLVHGAMEQRFKEYRDIVAEKMPKTAIVDVKAGHAVNAECAEGFNNAVIAFITSRNKAS